MYPIDEEESEDLVYLFKNDSPQIKTFIKILTRIKNEYVKQILNTNEPDILLKFTGMAKSLDDILIMIENAKK